MPIESADEMEQKLQRLNAQFEVHLAPDCGTHSQGVELPLDVELKNKGQREHTVPDKEKKPESQTPLPALLPQPGRQYRPAGHGKHAGDTPVPASE